MWGHLWDLNCIMWCCPLVSNLLFAQYIMTLITYLTVFSLALAQLDEIPDFKMNCHHLSLYCLCTCNLLIHSLWLYTQFKRISSNRPEMLLLCLFINVLHAVWSIHLYVTTLPDADYRHSSSAATSLTQLHPREWNVWHLYLLLPQSSRTMSQRESCLKSGFDFRSLQSPEKHLPDVLEQDILHWMWSWQICRC